MFLNHPDETELEQISLEEFENSLLKHIVTETFEKKDVYLQITDENHKKLKEIPGYITKKEYTQDDKSIYDQYGKIETKTYVFRFVRFYHSHKELVDCN
jgi:hypothetical protein